MLFAVLSVFILLAIFFAYFEELKEFVYITRRVRKLPGKKGYPILGNILEFLGGPEDVFRNLNTYVNETSRGGVTTTWMVLLPFIIITEPDVLETILKTPVNNKKGIIYHVLRPWLKDGLLTSDDLKWHARRKLLTPAFHFNVLQKFLHIFNEGSRSFVQSLKKHDSKETNVLSEVSNFTLDTICETAMGTSLNEQREEGEEYRSSVHKFGLIAVQRTYRTWYLVDAIFRLSKTYIQQQKILGILHGFTKRVIAARKATFSTSTKDGGHDEILTSSSRKNLAMLDLLISAQLRGEEIDDGGISEEVDTFVFEGHDTTAVSLSFTLMLLANNRECQDKVREELIAIFGNDDRDPTNSDLQEMKYLECCIKESLRLYPSVPKISRKLGEDIHLDNGSVIPQNSQILIFIYEMHRRADIYPNPEQFDPDRFLLENTVNRHPFAYLPFSAGPRNCIGQKFAMMEMKCLLSAVVRNYILEPIDTPETIRPNIVMDMVLRTKTPIQVKFIPRIN